MPKAKSVPYSPSPSLSAIRLAGGYMASPGSEDHKDHPSTIPFKREASPSLSEEVDELEDDEKPFIPIKKAKTSSTAASKAQSATTGKSKAPIPKAALRKLGKGIMERGQKAAMADIRVLAVEAGLSEQQVRSQIAKNRSNLYRRLHTFAETLE